MDEKHQATVSETSSHDLESPPPEQKKLSKKGIILVPQPSDDPNDPLVGNCVFAAASIYTDTVNSRTGPNGASLAPSPRCA